MLLVVARQQGNGLHDCVVTPLALTLRCLLLLLTTIDIITTSSNNRGQVLAQVWQVKDRGVNGPRLVQCPLVVVLIIVAALEEVLTHRVELERGSILYDDTSGGSSSSKDK